ncbi:MAG: thioredoxin domain-containing protein [Planctomycetota bacterium]
MLLFLSLALGTLQDTPHTGRAPLPDAEHIAELPADGGAEFNRLVFEASPYLRQHARNPVDWYPWGDEAFQVAAERDLPVFLSVGYSTCHWCHVMEHESFEDAEVARLMNENFVCVKVDREERPDLDHVYMSVTQALTGRGGWPMTVLLTPDAKPFWAGTYLPKESRFQQVGMLEFLPAVRESWKTRRDEILSSSESIVRAITQRSGSQPGAWKGAQALALAAEQLEGRYDPRHGGFGQRPKFPVPHQLLFLLTRYTRSGDAKLLEVVEHTLQSMRLGGIWDHVGFGFHRYSTDERWFLPHFEKMLYDQALMTLAYTAAWQVTDDPAYRRTAEEILDYVLRDLTSPRGGFLSAEDADSEGEEGLFYVWSPKAVRALLAKDDAEWFIERFGLTDEGNFLEEATQVRTGNSIPFLEQPLDDAEQERFADIRERLFAAREKRVHPFKDDKVLTDWNGLMIAALARAAEAFDEPRFAEAATRAADFVTAELRTKEGRLHKRWRAGQAGLDGTLEDYAFLSWGLSELYEATLEPRHLAVARELADTMIAHFHDAEGGGFFLSADDGLELFVRAKEIYDGALPSGNSVAALALLRLARMTGEVEYATLAEEIMHSFAGSVAPNPSAYTMLLAAVDMAEGPSHEVVIAGDASDVRTQALLRTVRAPFLPSLVLLHRPLEPDAAIAEIAPWTTDQIAIDGRPTAYVCREWACELPVDDAAALAAKLSARDTER